MYSYFLFVSTVVCVRVCSSPPVCIILITVYINAFAVTRKYVILINVSYE